MTLPGMSARRSGAAAGFTLLEIVAALAILGLVLGALATGVRFGMEVSATGHRLSAAAGGLETADQVLRRLIEGLDPGRESDPAPFLGSGHRLDCIAAMPDGGPPPERRMRAALFVDGGHRLILRWRPVLNARRLRALPPPP